LRKEVKDPKREFVEAMVARLEGTKKKPKPTQSRKSTLSKSTPKNIKPKPIISLSDSQSTTTTAYR
jgi:hypothetical protein